MNRWAYPVALAAALALTAQAEWTLALAVGWWMYVAWCWPAAVDVYVIASFRAGRDRAWAIALMGLSVSAAHSLPVLWPGGLPWWVRGLMSVVPVLVAWRVHEMRPVRQLQADLGATLADRTEQEKLLDRYRALGPEGWAAYARAAEGGPAAEVTPGPTPDGPRTGPGPDSPRTADRPALRSVPETPGRPVPSGGPARATPDQIRTARAACAGLDRPVSGKALKAAVRRAGGSVRNDNPALIKELVSAVNTDDEEDPQCRSTG